MKVAVWPADDGGCGHYRLRWPALALIAEGADIDLRRPEEGSGLQGIFVQRDGLDRLVALSGAPEVDVVVLQRPLSAWRADAVEVLQKAGVRVVVEIDDDFGALHPSNSSFLSCHPRRSPGMNWEHLARACRQADLVTVTTPALARRYGAHGRVAVLPNMVPARYLDIARPAHPGLIVGWTGSIETHPTDLQVTRGALERTLASTLEGQVATVRVVGTGKGVRQALRLSSEPEATGWLALQEYPYAMAEADVGLVPLDDIAFNAAKSALKMMEYAALGAPVIASPTPDNVRMWGEGIGLLASKPRDWATHLRRLLSNPEHRAEVAGRGREAMARFTIEGNADRWWDAWASCLDRKAAA